LRECQKASLPYQASAIREFFGGITKLFTVKTASLKKEQGKCQQLKMKQLWPSLEEEESFYKVKSRLMVFTYLFFLGI
ncbi:unnamed protein product, partial [Prunus brigantina]